MLNIPQAFSNKSHLLFWFDFAKGTRFTSALLIKWTTILLLFSNRKFIFRKTRNSIEASKENLWIQKWYLLVQLENMHIHKNVYFQSFIKKYSWKISGLIYYYLRHISRTYLTSFFETFYFHNYLIVTGDSKKNSSSREKSMNDQTLFFSFLNIKIHSWTSTRKTKSKYLSKIISPHFQITSLSTMIILYLYNMLRSLYFQMAGMTHIFKKLIKILNLKISLISHSWLEMLIQLYVVIIFLMWRINKFLRIR